MNYRIYYIALIACALLAGCTTWNRSISHTTYPGNEAGRPPALNLRGQGPESAFDYRGELSEYDVLGISRGEVTSENEIRRTLARSGRVWLRPDSGILLIQSGAVFPDGAMVEELTKRFRVIPFSGVPNIRRTPSGDRTESFDPESFAKSLRLTAARGGAEVIVCYWGVLESASEHLVTKTVSWVPVVNWMVPDEKQRMRIRLKIALIDVATGDWTVLTPPALEDARLSTSPRREVVDQKQVERLKHKAYAAGASELIKLYSREEARTAGSESFLADLH